MPQGDEIFQGLTVEEHLDSGAFTQKPGAPARNAKSACSGFSLRCANS